MSHVQDSTATHEEGGMSEKEHLSTAERTFKIQIPARVPLLRRMIFPANFIVLNPVSILPEQLSIQLCLLSSVDWISEIQTLLSEAQKGAIGARLFSVFSSQESVPAVKPTYRAV